MACYTGHHYRPGTSRDALSCTTTELISESHSPPKIEKHPGELGPTPVKSRKMPFDSILISVRSQWLPGLSRVERAGRELVSNDRRFSSRSHDRTRPEQNSSEIRSSASGNFNLAERPVIFYSSIYAWSVTENVGTHGNLVSQCEAKVEGSGYSRPKWVSQV